MFDLKCCMFHFNYCMSWIKPKNEHFPSVSCLTSMLHVWVSCCIFHVNCCMFMWLSCLTLVITCLTSIVVCFMWFFYMQIPCYMFNLKCCMFHLNCCMSWQKQKKKKNSLSVSCLTSMLHIWPQLLHLSRELLLVYMVLMFNLNHCMFDLTCCMSHVTSLHANFILLADLRCCMFHLNCCMSWIKSKNENFPTYFMFDIQVTLVIASLAWPVACLRGSQLKPSHCIFDLTCWMLHVTYCIFMSYSFLTPWYMHQFFCWTNLSFALILKEYWKLNIM